MKKKTFAFILIPVLLVIGIVASAFAGLFAWPQIGALGLIGGGSLSLATGVVGFFSRQRG